ncbi:uncharacterized protein LTR77_000871 [Saxophila tyrrhenica]|uniref:Uncharacterized protein n=1 Tax=Saxophila tyrrhenica TaxID=1690608 RepID=A0AAV9PS46_9PEZI|nr:hypothetical protein LTR77_000871 [Saxophila tyrrhenica]
MFRTLSNTADPRDHSDPIENKPKPHPGDRKSSDSTQSDCGAIENVACPDRKEEYEDEVHHEKATQRASQRPSRELARTTSNALSRVSSRLTTRSLPDPGPPPDGGLKAWTQIACGWLAIFTCWGWINCFGMGVMATWFSKKRSFAMGCASTGNAIGGMIYPVIVRELLPKVGFAWTVRVLGFMNLALLGLVLAFMRSRLPPRKSDALIDWSAFREVPFTFFVIGLYFMVWDVYFTLYYISSFGVEALGLPFEKATVLLIIINGIGVPARVVPGYVADRVGQLNLLVPISWCLTLVAWSWLAVESIAGLYVWICFYGLMAAALQCLFPPTVAALTSDLRVVGTRLGMSFAVMGFAALTGPPIGGAIQGAQGGDYIGAQSWAAASTLLCSVFYSLSRMTRAEWKWKAKV